MNGLKSHKVFSVRGHRWWGVAAFAGLGLISYGIGRAAAPRTPTVEYGAVSGTGKTPRLLSGSTGILTVQQPSGQARFTVNFPFAFKKPPEVLLTVVGGGDTPIVARLSGPSTTGGFQGVLTAPYFLAGVKSAEVSVNWLAVGEVNAPDEPRL
jgi:hypothetical protein